MVDLSVEVLSAIAEVGLCAVAVEVLFATAFVAVELSSEKVQDGKALSWTVRLPISPQLRGQHLQYRQ